ncbi:recombinase family protein [Tumebacillus algifaecis]|uniref:recombinase family protein n=1 Tax=Tumebacillus algifaecis TaxID=1214604 RepID=UPI00223D3659|nr:recombinase family protein [Tumebacillus algifaecis]
MIFQLYLQGRGVEAIAKQMDALGFPTPAQVAGKRNAGFYWQGSSIKLILQNPHYVGDLVQGRSHTKSVTNKARETVPEEDWVVISDAHEPIILREDFEAVQSLMKSRSVKRPKMKKHLFTNYVYCADCGTSLWYIQFRKGYVCGSFKKHGATACSSHAIKEE